MFKDEGEGQGGTCSGGRLQETKETQGKETEQEEEGERRQPMQLTPRPSVISRKQDLDPDAKFKKDGAKANTHVHFVRHSFEPLNEFRRRACPLRQLLQILRELRL